MIIPDETVLIPGIQRSIISSWIDTKCIDIISLTIQSYTVSLNEEIVQNTAFYDIFQIC